MIFVTTDVNKSLFSLRHVKILFCGFKNVVKCIGPGG